MLISLVLWNLMLSRQLASGALISGGRAIPFQGSEAHASYLVTENRTAAARTGLTVPNQSHDLADVSISGNGYIAVSPSAASFVSDPTVSLVEVSATISGAVTPLPTPISTCQPGVCWGNVSGVSVSFRPQKSAQTAGIISLTETRATLGDFIKKALTEWFSLRHPQADLFQGAPDGPFGSPPLERRRHRRAPAPADRLPQAPEQTSKPTRNAV